MDVSTAIDDRCEPSPHDANATIAKTMPSCVPGRAVILMAVTLSLRRKCLDQVSLATRTYALSEPLDIHSLFHPE